MISVIQGGRLRAILPPDHEPTPEDWQAETDRQLMTRAVILFDAGNDSLKIARQFNVPEPQVVRMLAAMRNRRRRLAAGVAR